MDELQQAYVNLLRATVTNKLYRKSDKSPFSPREIEVATQALEVAKEKLRPLLEYNLPQSMEIQIAMRYFTPEMMAEWFRRNTWDSLTVLDEPPLRNVEECVAQILREGIPGDLIECGVFRGGVCVLMRGLLKAFGDKTRKVWVADSFQGLPAPDPLVSPLDAFSHELLKVIGAFQMSQAAVEEGFRACDLLDEQVCFLPGWFHESLPVAPIESLALLRLDGDYYESTMPALRHLYPKLSPGGFIIIDDYGITNLGARRAVQEYREAEGITEPLLPVNHFVYYWRKQPKPATA